MNCSDVQRILNDATRQSLSVSGQVDLHAHLDACPACHGEWRAQELIATLTVSPASSDLLTLARHALHAHASGSRRAGMPRSLIVGCVLLASAAAAAVLIGRSLEPAAEADVAVQESPTASELLDVATSESAEPESASAEAPVDNSDSDQNTSGDPAPTISLDRSWVAVLPIPPEAASAEVLAVANERRDMLMRRIQETEGLHLADPDRVQTYFDGGMTDVEVAQAMGAGVVFIPSIEPGSRSVAIRFTRLDPATDELLGGPSYPYREDRESLTAPDAQSVSNGAFVSFVSDEDIWENNLAVTLGVIVREAHPGLSPSREKVAAENQRTLLDASLSEDARVGALEYLRTYGYTIDQIAIDAGIGILESSADPEVRLRVLVALIEVDDPGLVQPLLRALGYDPSPAVRREAAAALAKFSEDASVREPLVLAESNDDAEAVRNVAARSTLSDSDRLQQRRETFFNRDLPARQRMGELNIGFFDPRIGPRMPMDNEIGRELVDIAVNSPDLDERGFAFMQLNYVSRYVNAGVYPGFRMDPELREPLLAVLEDDPDPGMRASAANALRLFVDQDDVREALEHARDNDPDRSIRNAARTALDAGQ